MSLEDTDNLEQASRGESIRRQNRLLRAENQKLQAERDRDTEIRRLVDSFDSRNLEVPHWTRQAAGRGGKRGIATLHLTDTHFDEVIEDAQILGFNRYDRRIAEMRLRRLGEGTLKLARDYMKGVEYDGATVLVTGDVFSGDIHEELARTNQGTLLEGCAFWVPRMVAFLRLLAEDFRKVHVATVVGNHGRMTAKPIYKNRPQSNIEWLFWHWVADHLAAARDDRVTFDIAAGLSMNVDIYGTTYALEHGDEFRGGSGIQGARAPLAIGQHRTAVQRMAMGLPMNWLVVGHFHQLQPPAQGLIMGGSLKGYDEYAAGRHFRPERPQQGLWITSSEHGPTISAPVFCDDRVSEGW